MRRQPATFCLITSPARQHCSMYALALLLQTLADPRCRRGRRHPFVAVRLTARSEWSSERSPSRPSGSGPRKDAPQDALARFVARMDTAFAVRTAPSGAAIRQLIQRTCPGGPIPPSSPSSPGRTAACSRQCSPADAARSSSLGRRLT